MHTRSNNTPNIAKRWGDLYVSQLASARARAAKASAPTLTAHDEPPRSCRIVGNAFGVTGACTGAVGDLLGSCFNWRTCF